MLSAERSMVLCGIVGSAGKAHNALAVAGAVAEGDSARMGIRVSATRLGSSEVVAGLRTHPLLTTVLPQTTKRCMLNL